MSFGLTSVSTLTHTHLPSFQFSTLRLSITSNHPHTHTHTHTPTHPHNTHPSTHATYTHPPPHKATHTTHTHRPTHACTQHTPTHPHTHTLLTSTCVCTQEDRCSQSDACEIPGVWSCGGREFGSNPALAPAPLAACVSVSRLRCVSLSFPLLGSCRSQAVCSLNRLDLSAASGAASVFNSAHVSQFTLVCGCVGAAGFFAQALCP